MMDGRDKSDGASYPFGPADGPSTRSRAKSPVPTGPSLVSDAWQGLRARICSARPHPATRLVERLAGQEGGLYWYPGCGQDLAPALLTPPGNPLGISLSGKGPGRPAMLWLNDLPGSAPPDMQTLQPYPYLWDRFDTQIAGIRARPLSISGLPDGSTLYGEATLRRGRHGLEIVPYLHTALDSRDLLAFFAACRLPITWVALIKQGGFAGEQAHWLPPLVEEQRSRLQGGPDAYIGDRDFNREGVAGFTLQVSPCLSGWGFEMARLWLRDGVPAVRTRDISRRATLEETLAACERFQVEIEQAMARRSAKQTRDMEGDGLP